jgi:RNA polymerase sigma-70 factor, ECF subfamily
VNPALRSAPCTTRCAVRFRQRRREKTVSVIDPLFSSTTFSAFTMAYALSVNTDQALLSALRDGSTSSNAAANEFVRKYQKFVYATALRYLKNSDDAYDASQEVFIKALKSIGGFRGESSLSTWLYRITMNICFGMKRKEKLRQFVGLDDVAETESSYGFTPDQEAENNDFHARFDALLAQLPEKQRQTFVLRYFDELSYEEISQMLGTSVGGLKANYFHASKKLAHLLQNAPK